MTLEELTEIVERAALIVAAANIPELYRLKAFEIVLSYLLAR